MKILILVMIIVFGIGSCSTVKQVKTTSAAPEQPYAQREFRAAWVATVANIDWPSQPGLDVATQKQQALAILDSAANLHLNAIIFQVRPQCDALYPSKIEPWSYYLTGEQGQAPEPFYDPLKFWIDAAHQRGIELHAWFNPYRAHHPKGDKISDSSVVYRHPELVRKLDNGYHWLDPAMPATQDYSFNVVMDVVRRYDLDGVHFDDYFYPYGDGNFPDDDTWQAYQAAGGTLERGDWRRDNVNKFISRLYQAIKNEKPHVKFGISPFGIWRPNNPASIKGFDQYRILYADARLWLNEGWVDYWTPQLYWPINQIPQSFPVLLGWWVNENKKDRNLWPGLFTSRVRDEKGVDENLNQVMVTRGFVPNGPGHVHFSMRALMADSTGLADALRAGPYKQAALVPASPWLDHAAPAQPQVSIEEISDSLKISWSHSTMSDVFRWVVYYQYDTAWEYRILNHSNNAASFALSRDITVKKRGEAEPEHVTQRLTQIAVSAVDRTGNESKRVYKKR
jgi:uncharacterized lipoprotein YddW (UPF0748 family)